MRNETTNARNALGLRGLVREPDDGEAEVYRIGDLAREFDVTLRALRFYEDRNLLSPARSGSTRLYSAEDRERLKLILLAKRIGFSLVEIQEILEVHEGEVLSRDNARKLLARFEGQVGVLEKQRKELDEALVELDAAIEHLKEIA